MRQILAGRYDFQRKVISAQEARRIFKDQPYKLELIDGLEQGDFDEYGNPLRRSRRSAFIPMTRSWTYAAARM